MRLALSEVMDRPVCKRFRGPPEVSGIVRYKKSSRPINPGVERGSGKTAFEQPVDMAFRRVDKKHSEHKMRVREAGAGDLREGTFIGYETSQTPEDHIRLFSMVDVLEPLSHKELVDFACRTPVMDFEPEQLLYTPEYRADMLFILLRGRVRIYQAVGGHEVTLDHVDSGTIFGGTALDSHFEGVYEGLWAETTRPSSIALIRRGAFERLVMDHPEVGVKAIRLFGGRLYAMQNRMGDIALKEVPARLASTILYVSRREGIETEEGFNIAIHYTHQQLGAMIGCDRVAVTRAFNRLREAGAVDLVGRRIHVKDMETLKKIARG